MVRIPVPELTQPANPVPLHAALVERASPPPAPQREAGLATASPKVARLAPSPPPVIAASQEVDAISFSLPSTPLTAETEEAAPGDASASEEATPPLPSSAVAVSSVAEPAEVAPSRQLPAVGELIYTLYMGTDGFSVGRSTYAWTVEGETYRLVSDSETTGIVDVFRPQRLTYVSQGRLTRGGLRPERFTMTRTRRGETDEARAHLDWNAGQLTYGRPAHVRTAPLPQASQDIVSFILQLALNPPPQGRIRLPITNGTRIETYELDVEAEETIETPFGPLVALPLKQVRKERAESIEIWLAVEYRYFPVKLRFRDREGNPTGEQVVSAIRIGRP
jgi:hypothetical protein